MPLRGYEILDAGRIIPADGSGRQIEWRVSLRTRMHFRDLLEELVDLEQEPESFERETKMEALREAIRTLPDFPRGYDPEQDVIVPVTTSEMR